MENCGYQIINQAEASTQIGKFYASLQSSFPLCQLVVSTNYESEN